MTQGKVNASTLNLREMPSTAGPIIAALSRGTPVDIIENVGDEWLKVASAGRTGFVSAKYIDRDAGGAASDAVPAADTGDIRADANNAYAPDGTPFAKVWKEGFMTTGKTAMGAFIDQMPQRFADVRAPIIRVMQAVSQNEGKLEAINSYDNAFISFGIFQWTAGAASDPGELGSVLNALKLRDAVAFQEYFGRYKLDIEPMSPSATTGYLSLDGQPLRDPAAKAVLRRPEWAYRFWRAGHEPAVRECQIRHAMARIDRFYGQLRPNLQGHAIKDYVTSDYGVALVLDQHVNRPGHVPRTLAEALSGFAAAAKAPELWTDDDEAAFLARYIDKRAATNMTHSTARAQAIHKAVMSGGLSAARHSFA